MIIVVALLTLLSAPQQQEPCADLASCRAAADAAREAKDYEAFHDLAWATYRKGKSNDPELMLLVARAQSLSGRPGDALVMLERIAAAGAATDAATSDDFARVRALPRWSEVAEKLSAAAPENESAPSSKDPTPSAKVPAPSPKAPAPSSKDPAPSPKPPAPSSKDPAPSPKAPAPSSKDPAPSSKAPAPSAKEPLSFSTLLSPDALAYDAVSRRFIIADRKARRVAVVDEHSGQVATMVGSLGSPGEIVGMAIDAQQGDLWIASTGDGGSVLHKLQLISGRSLTTVQVDLEVPLTAITYARGTGLIASDTNGVVWNVKPDGKAEKLMALEYVPQALAADARGRLYVSGGTSRFARFSIGSTLRRIDTISIDAAIPKGAPFVAVGSTSLTFVVPAEGSFEIRRISVK